MSAQPAAGRLGKRQYALAAGLAVAVAATLWAAQLEDAAEAPGVALAAVPTAKPRAAPSPVASAPAAPPAWEAAAREPWPEASGAQLAAWMPPPPPPAPAAPPVQAQPPAAPVAPPFPYQLIGRLEEGGQHLALLTGPNRSLSAKAGDVIDGQWRVDRVEPSGLALTWLPAQQAQNISFRPSS